LQWRRIVNGTGTTLKKTIHLRDLEGGQNRDDFGLHCLASLINDDQIEMPSSQADVYKSENSQKSAHLKHQLKSVAMMLTFESDLP